MSFENGKSDNNLCRIKEQKSKTKRNFSGRKAFGKFCSKYRRR